MLGALRPPRPIYYVAWIGAGAVAAWALVVWVYQVRTGMGAAGLTHPVNWGVYIANFVFWIGIAHSGTLISAVLHLVRARWRTAISRASEAMTIFAVATAGLFPLIHLGRVWVFYYILPYPSERQIWPNFVSPLVWDVLAISTYFVVSVIFFYVGLLPDLAAARDRAEETIGPGSLRTKLYRFFSLGWSGTGNQWWHRARGFLFFAALATPLVVSVHSIVSWDFAVGLPIGWHTILFPPYFVAGAIHSGLAMVLMLLIPLRKALHLEPLMTRDHFAAVAKTMVVTALIVGYAYLVEPFIAWLGQDIFDKQYVVWRATGRLSLVYWSLSVLNVLFPLMFVFRRVRRSFTALFVIAVLVNVGMWLERYMIVTGSTSHDFMPHSWGPYSPNWVELSITAGAFAWFLFWFLGFTKSLPVVPLCDVKEQRVAQEPRRTAPEERLAGPVGEVVRGATHGVLAVFDSRERLVEALRRAIEAGHRKLEVFSPIVLPDADELLGRKHSPVRYWTLCGGLAGMVGGFWLAIGSASVNDLIVGGKLPLALIPFCIVAFEGTILLGSLGNLTGLIVHGRLWGPRLPRAYRRCFSGGKFGLLAVPGIERLGEAEELLETLGAEEVHVLE